MSTRATVWLKQPSKGESAYLYHHCDGYALDEDLDDVLRNLSKSQWNVEDAINAIVANDDAYGRHHVDSIGWDSEYVYVIDLDNRTLKKFDCGLWFAEEHKDDNMTIGQEKTQEKYLERTLKYPEQSEEDKDEKVKMFVTTLKTIIDATAKNANLNDEMKKEAVKLIYEYYCAN